MRKRGVDDAELVRGEAAAKRVKLAQGPISSPPFLDHVRGWPETAWKKIVEFLSFNSWMYKERLLQGPDSDEFGYDGESYQVDTGLLNLILVLRGCGTPGQQEAMTIVEQLRFGHFADDVGFSTLWSVFPSILLLLFDDPWVIAFRAHLISAFLSALCFSIFNGKR